MSLLTRSGYVVDEGDLEPWHADELTVQANKNPYIRSKIGCKDGNRNRSRSSITVMMGTVAVPRFWGHEHFGRPKAEFGHVEKAPRLVFNGELRSSVQRDAVERATSHLRSHGGGILSSKTGFGKTVVSLNVACAMGLEDDGRGAQTVPRGISGRREYEHSFLWPAWGGCNRMWRTSTTAT